MIVAFGVQLALGLLLAAAPVAASAQAVTDIKFGQTLTKKVGTKTDIYRFVGGSGTTIKATLTAPGKSALILYTPAGEEMLTAQGSGSVTLEAILPLWDVFFIGVVRQNAGQPYSLKLTGVDPDPHLALFARDTGYAATYMDKAKPYLVTICWIEPGVKIRRTFVTGVEEVSIGRGGKEYGSWKGQDGKTNVGEHSVRFDGQTMIRTVASGKQRTTPVELLFGSDPTAKYRGYLCDAK